MNDRVIGRLCVQVTVQNWILTAGPILFESMLIRTVGSGDVVKLSTHSRLR